MDVARTRKLCVNAFPLWRRVSVHENKNAYASCGCVSLHLRLWSETYDPATSTKTFSTFNFSTCKIHTTKSAKGEYNRYKSIMGNKILCSMLTVTLIIMCLIFQVAAVSGNKGLAELIANFTERDIGRLGLLWESKVSSWWFGHCVKQFLRVQLNFSFSGVDFGRVA